LAPRESHHLAGEDDIRAAGAGDADATVEDGSFSTTLTLDESDLLVALGTEDFDDQDRSARSRPDGLCQDASVLRQIAGLVAGTRRLDDSRV
jgi:hypothetical protein